MKKPFFHEYLDVKKEFLDLAYEYDRMSQSNDDVKIKGAYTFSAALLFMNHADYLAQWFAYSLQELVDRAVADYYSRQITISRSEDNDNEKHITIGESIKIIDRYMFSDKRKIIGILNRIADARNKVAHQILKTQPEDFETFDKNFVSLRDNTQELIDFTDQFRLGMPPRSLRDIVNGLTNHG